MREIRVKAYRRGLFAETVMALLLRLKGHRIVARRYKTPVGEIDLVALKGKRLAFIEVSDVDQGGRRLDTGQAAAADHQGRAILARRASGLRGHHDIAFDVVLAAPWAWPRYIENAFSVA
jgi:putative endonuclease